MSSIFSREFWIDAAERAIATVAETLLAALGANAAAAMVNFGELTITDWLWVPLVAGALSIIKSVAAAGSVAGPTASLSKTVARITRDGYRWKKRGDGGLETQTSLDIFTKLDG